ncbi:MAG: DUF1249 domain-containing protein [Kangiellaceae bacterium]|nr:DUF1249 domain-containing protein [Kangiellaceae bacterium]
MSSYKPCLEEFITQCEINYHLILELMPFLNVKRNEDLSLPSDKALQFRPIAGSKIDFKLVDKARYTTTLQLRLKSCKNSASIKIDLLVRLYHDAELLEVMDKKGPKALKPVIKGPQLKNEQTDEKRQLNRFLGESLKFCLSV